MLIKLQCLDFYFLKNALRLQCFYDKNKNTLHKRSKVLESYIYIFDVFKIGIRVLNLITSHQDFYTINPIQKDFKKM